MPYQIALDHDNEGELEAIMVQPAAPGRLEYPRRLYSAATVQNDGQPFVDLVYNVLLPADFSALNTQFGVTRAAPSREVTISVKDDTGSFANYNGSITYPENPKYRLGKWRDVTYRVYLKEAL